MPETVTLTWAEYEKLTQENVNLRKDVACWQERYDLLRKDNAELWERVHAHTTAPAHQCVEAKEPLNSLVQALRRLTDHAAKDCSIFCDGVHYICSQDVLDLIDAAVKRSAS